LPALVAPEDQDDLDAVFLVRSGDIGDVIESVVYQEHADVVVMGTHGRSLFSRLFIGSIAQGLLRKLGVPVLTVCHVSRPVEFKPILFATDFGPDSDRGFEFALDMAVQAGSVFVVAHTIDKRPEVTYETPEVHQLFDEERAHALKQTDE